MRTSTVFGGIGLSLLTVISFKESGILVAAMWFLGGILSMAVAYRITRSVKNER